MSQTTRPLCGILALALVGLLAVGAKHDQNPAGPEREPESNSTKRTVLRLAITNAITGKLTPARFSLTVDGRPYYPAKLNSHGLRFVSIHESKKQKYVVLYARGTGLVEIPLPTGAKTVGVAVAKGFEFLPVTVTKTVKDLEVTAEVSLRRWTNQAEDGWLAADEHVHYDRLKQAGDKDWLTMLAADDLACAHFMVLKGGKVPGVWARQYSYGKGGEAFDGKRLIRSGEEYRDSAQGHINLLGLTKVIQPISTGGIGKPPVFANYPPLLDVFRENRKRGGLGGVAHGGSLGRHPTAVVDTVLGGVDFFEIGNSHLYSLDLWYRLMSCGFHLAPAAGTDLPNFPFRDSWQPFLGGMRMYVKTKGRDFDSWKRNVKAGRVIVSSGPILTVSVDGAGPGDVVKLPAGGGEVTIDAQLASPVGLESLELIQMGKTMPVEVRKAKSGGVFRQSFRKQLTIRESCWLAVRGEGVPIKSLRDSISRNRDWIKTETVAHSAAIRVIVDDKPIRSDRDAAGLIALLRQQREYYRTKGRYLQGKERVRVLGLFEKAITALQSRRSGD